MKTRLLVVPAALLLTLLAGCGDDTGTTETPAGSDPTTSETTDAPTDSPTDGTSGTCAWVTDAAGPAAKEVEPPPAEPETAGELTIETNRGDITVTLDAESAPCTVGSFTWLASQGYFDGTKCHRLVVDFVLQCGDPSATGMGGPGYSFADELEGDETYPVGTLAMANSGPDTNGSQFFIVLKDAQLPPAYTVFGTVDEAGMEVAQEIEAEGNGPDGVAPAEDVIIESVS
ncbi:MAG TPA: peptidylprolyl isomerase [Nocardioidaceae bacterium]|nr:peptidylprolyl isomerase [Nocardioidaceae bacterium]